MANERVVIELIVDAKGAAAAIAQFNTAMDGANAKQEKIRETSTRMLVGVPQSVDRVSTSLKKLQASLDPITKAQFQMEREMQRSMNLIERAVRTGVTTEQQAANTIAAIRQKQVRDLDALRDAHMRTARASAANQNQGGGVSRFGALNTSAQFQDIAVTAAMGQSPLTIALQQGTQLAAAFGELGAAGAVKQLFSALRMLVSPIGLVTIALTGAAAFAIQYFMKWKSGAEDSAEALKEQAELIDRVASKWGDALPSLSAYNTELENTRDIQEAIAAGEAVARQQFAPVREQVPAISIDTTELVTRLQEMGVDPVAILKLQDAFAGLQAKIDASTASGEDAKRVQAEILDLANSTGFSTISEYAKQFQSLAVQLDVVAENARKVREETALLNRADIHPELMLGVGRDQLNQRNVGLNEQARIEAERVQRELAEGHRFDPEIPTPTGRPNDIEMWDERTEAAEKAAKAAEENAKAIERERKAAEAARKPIEDLIRTQRERLDILQLEISLMGQSEQVRATLISQLQTEQQIRKLGIDQNSAEAAAIRDNAAAITQYTLELDDLKKAQEDLNERAQFFGDLTVGVFDDLTSGADGFEKAVKRIVNALADAVIQAVLLGQGPLASLFGTSPTGGASVGGALGSLFGGAASGGGGAGGAAAFGTAGGFMTMLQTAGGFGKVPDNVGAGPSAIIGKMSQYAQAIKDIESGGGNYSALGPITRTGDRAYGAYQIMGNNVPSWSEKWLGQKMTGPQLLGNQGAQDKIFAGQFGSTIDKFGSAQDAASVWHSGRPLSQAGGAIDQLGTKTTDYVEKFNTAVGRATETTAVATKDIGSLGNAGASATQGIGQFSNALAQFPSAPGAFGGGAFGAGGGGLASLFGGGSGPSFTPFELDYVSTHVGLFHEGGIAGAPTRMRYGVDPRLFIGAPRYHRGGIAGDEVPAILQRGERIVPVSNRGTANMAPVVVNNTVVNQAGVDVDQKSTNRPDGGVDIVTTIKRIIADDASRPGTPMDKALTARNARPALKRYG